MRMAVFPVLHAHDRPGHPPCLSVFRAYGRAGHHLSTVRGSQCSDPNDQKRWKRSAKRRLLVICLVIKIRKPFEGKSHIRQARPWVEGEGKAVGTRKVERKGRRLQGGSHRVGARVNDGGGG